MSGFALLSNFACEDCGSPGIMLPEHLSDASAICCSGCGAGHGTWGAFKFRARKLIMSAVDGGVCDPRVAGVDLALKF